MCGILGGREGQPTITGVRASGFRVSPRSFRLDPVSQSQLKGEFGSLVLELGCLVSSPGSAIS